MDIPKRPRIFIGGEEPDHPEPEFIEEDPLFEDDDGMDDYYEDFDDDDADPPYLKATYKTFSELGITEEPYVTQFKEKFGHYPTMEVKSAHRLPTRYSTPSGEQKYHMKTTYRPGELFKVTGTEPGKRTPTSVNIILTHPTDRDSRIVLTPKDLIAKMHINSTETLSTTERLGDLGEAAPTPTPTKIISEDVKDILEKRKKEAAISI
ncbi:uncharacterized protein Dvar_40760 [Desulfosarcina variabilis str. Montpellier]|uniref:hypothetical protein n=1 Tax=Desulfosarcina variabilis TaxID=2300 RepID=UPI003AFAEB4C